MNLVDGLSAAYLAFATARARKRGLEKEFHGLVRWVVAFGAGCGLHSFVGRGIRAVFGLGADASGALGFLASFGGAFAIVRALRRKLSAFVTAKVAPQAQATGGAIAGALRALLVLATAVAAGRVVPIAPVRSAVAERSLLSRVVGVVLPGREEPAAATRPAEPSPAAARGTTSRTR